MPRLALLFAQADPPAPFHFGIAEQVISGLLLLAGIAMWITIAMRYQSGRQIVEAVPHRIVPWGGLVTLGAIALFIATADGANAIIRALWARDHGISFEHAAKIEISVEPILMIRSLMGLVAGRLLFVVFSIWLLLSVTPAKRDDIGLSAANWRRDLVLGVAGFFAIVPAIMLLLLALTNLTGEGAKHPIFDAWRSIGDPSLLVWSTLAAVVAAPLAEELLFRGIIQGWLERMFTPPPGWDAETGEVRPLVDASDSADGKHHTLLHRSPSGPGSGMLPVVVSSALFSLVHFGQGIAPIPLFFFAIGVGYLYRQTHSIWPGVIVHFMLNAVSMAMLVMTT